MRGSHKAVHEQRPSFWTELWGGHPLQARDAAWLWILGRPHCWQKRTATRVHRSVSVSWVFMTWFPTASAHKA